MIYLYYDKYGALKEIINDRVSRKGSSNIDGFSVYCELFDDENYEITDLWYVQQFPDKTKSNEISFVDNAYSSTIPYDKSVDYKYFKDFTTYKFYKVEFDNSLLSQNGLNLGTIRLILNRGASILSLGLFTFNVEDNIIKNDNDITQSQYDYLLTRVSDFTSVLFVPSVSEEGIISWTNNAGKENPKPVDIMGNGIGTATASIKKLSPTETPTISVDLSGSDRKNKNLNFNFAIPQGEKGEQGDGVTTASIEVETLASNVEATADVELSGSDKTKQNVNFKLGIPKGQDGIGGVYKFEVINGQLYMYYATEQTPDIYLITKDNYSSLGVDKSLIGNLVFIYKE